MEIPDEAWDEWYAEKQRRNYRMELMAHPHPSDPDHPDPEEYGIFEEEDDACL
jgi:hypothetical protein